VPFVAHLLGVARASSARSRQYSGSLKYRAVGMERVVPRIVNPFNSGDRHVFLFQPDLGRRANRKGEAAAGG